LKKYLAIFRTNFLNSLAYPAELFARSGMIVLFMWIFYQLWRVVYSAGGSASIAGLSLHDTIWYLLLAETLELGRPRLARLISEQVKDGSIAYLVNKPYHFLLYQLFSGLGESLPRMGMLFVIGGALVWIMAGAPPPLTNWPAALLALAGAWLLHFCANSLIGLAAFVSEEVAPYEWIYQKLVFILGGMLVPLDFYPTWLQNIARSLPFAYMTYGPSRLFVEPSAQVFIQVFSGQLLWLAVLGCILAFAFARGMKSLAINGG
jgi:ABC-2 type transport system permease protein